jgi:hypothetical protein
MTRLVPRGADIIGHVRVASEANPCSNCGGQPTVRMITRPLLFGGNVSIWRCECLDAACDRAERGKVGRGDTEQEALQEWAAQNR